MAGGVDGEGTSQKRVAAVDCHGKESCHSIQYACQAHGYFHVWVNGQIMDGAASITVHFDEFSKRRVQNTQHRNIAANKCRLSERTVALPLVSNQLELRFLRQARFQRLEIGWLDVRQRAELMHLNYFRCQRCVTSGSANESFNFDRRRLLLQYTVPIV